MGDDEGLADRNDQLSEYEGSLLSLVLRFQPVKPYELLKMYTLSPVSRYNASAGSIYPLVKRLEDRGFIESVQLRGDRRKTKVLACTATGRQAVRRWLTEITAGHVLLDDPWRTRILLFGELDREQQLEWVARARLLVTEKAREVELFNEGLDSPFKDLAYSNAQFALEARMRWLDGLAAELLRTPSADR